MKRIKLTKEEKALEAAVLRGEFHPVSPKEERKIRQIIERYRKGAKLNRPMGV